MSGNSRVIFSVYKEVNDESITDYKKQQLKNYKDDLIKRQQQYADFCNADYFVYENNNQLVEIDEYNTIQFFKIHQLEKLAEQYDEILYLDLDIIPFKFVNFFESHDLSKLCCFQQDCYEWGLKRYVQESVKREEIPYFKVRPVPIQERLNNSGYYFHKENIEILDSQNWWVKACAKNAMLLLDNHTDFNNMIVNTGVIGGNSGIIKKLCFIDGLNDMLDALSNAKEDNIYPIEVSSLIKPNNEVFLTYLIEKNNIETNYLDESWNYIVDDFRHDTNNDDSIFLHVINKEFDKYNYKYNLFKSD